MQEKNYAPSNNNNSQQYISSIPPPQFFQPCHKIDVLVLSITCYYTSIHKFTTLWPLPPPLYLPSLLCHSAIHTVSIINERFMLNKNWPGEMIQNLKFPLGILYTNSNTQSCFANEFLCYFFLKKNKLNLFNFSIWTTVCIYMIVNPPLKRKATTLSYYSFFSKSYSSALRPRSSEATK